MPLQETSGTASYDAFGGGVAAVPTYIEDVFSTWLYQGNGSTQTITNGIDLSGKGGLAWLKERNAANNHYLQDTIRGPGQSLSSNTTSASATANILSSFTSSGFVDNGQLGSSNVVSWTFRKQPKFFDVVTYTGNGANRTISHNLGSVPGAIIIKRTDTSDNWVVYHRSLGNDYELFLNLTVARNYTNDFNFTDPTSTGFSVNGNDAVNANGGTYVAYLFAHNAGGFGLTGTDNVISCGSYTGSSSGTTVTLGYEPQWVLVKKTNLTSNWYLLDNMRGMTVYNTAGKKELYPNTSGAEVASADTAVSPTATGFTVGGGGMSDNGDTYIYIAIRRGPMKTPTSGTSVFGLNARSGTGANATVTGGAGVTDLAIIKNRTGTNPSWLWASRLTGTGYLSSNATTAETAAGTTILQANPWDVMDGVKVGTTSTTTNASSNTFINYLIDRAPGFFDVVCLPGSTSTAVTANHNLGVAPEMIILKARNGVENWAVYHSALGVSKFLKLNATDASATPGNNPWGTTSPTATTFVFNQDFFASTETVVAYLFASCPGVSKVGSYTGNGTTQTINCGFTGGARFVLIKRTDSTGNWYVYDTARGMTTLTDPYLLLNSTAAESATLGSVTTVSSGFAVNASILAAINTNAASYIYFSVA